MNVAMIRSLQEKLKELGHYKGSIDGDRGPKTNKAVGAALRARGDDLPDGWEEWSEKRRAVAFVQLWARDEGIDAGTVDGWVGPQTTFALEALQEMLETGRGPRMWRDETPLDVNPNGWPKESAVEALYGKHGVKKGYTPPLVRVECPWRLKIAWNLNQTVSTISIHEKCADSLGRILTKVHDHYGDAEIQRLRLDHFGGSYNPRKMRGSTRWSMHAWGVAIDWDPENNQLRWNRGQASLAHPDYIDWWRCWEEEGWLSLGRVANFDWMHVQAVKR
jgi:hypothetical protein